MKQQYLSSRFAPMSDCNQPRYLRQLHSDDVLSISCNECLPCLLKKSRNDTLDVTISTQTFKYFLLIWIMQHPLFRLCDMSTFRIERLFIANQW